MKEKRIQLLQANLLWEIWHMDKDVTEDELALMVQEHAFPEEIKAKLCTVTTEQVKQRLFGGFPCGNHNGYHVVHNSGAYTYLNSNVDLTGADRLKYWRTLETELNAAGVEDFYKVDKSAPFTQDYPEETKHEQVA